MTTASAPPTVAIVGGGAVGVALLDALVERLAATALRARPHVVLFERSATLGPGLAYADDDAPYRLNTSAQTMTLSPARRADFAAWLAAQAPARREGDEPFCERRVFGAYARDFAAHALERARRRGLAVSVVHDEVTSLAPRNARAGGYRVATRSHGAHDADVAVLALGHLPGTRFGALEGPGFVASPYPSAALRAAVPAGARAAILGTGLSAIDAALALVAAGHEGPITLASRSGLLPAVRGPLPPVTLAHVTRENVARATDHGARPLRGSTVLAWIERELADRGHVVDWDRDFPAWADPRAHLEGEIAAAERGPRASQCVGEALNPMIEILWRHLDEGDKGLFLERFYARFMSHWVPIPLVTARRVLALLREGRARVARDLRGVTRDATTGELRLHFADGESAFDAVIDATGAPRALPDLASPLLSALLRQGTIAPHAHGGVRVDFDSLRVVAADGRLDPSLYAVGPLTFGTHLFTSTLEQSVEKAARVAALVAAEVSRRHEKDTHVDATPHPS